MKIGIIGLTSVTLDFAKRSAESGYELAIANTHTIFCKDDLKNRIRGNVKFVDSSKAAKADIILLFTTKEALESLIITLPDMTGKIILLTNNFITGDGFTFPLLKIRTSHEIISSLIPEAYVVKIYNVAVYSKATRNPEDLKTKIYFSSCKSIFIKKIVGDFLESIGFSAVHI